jgi:hypothetical protein
MSRPSRYTKKIFLWLSPEMDLWLIRRCSELGISKSEYFRVLLLQEISRTAESNLKYDVQKKNKNVPKLLRKKTL